MSENTDKEPAILTAEIWGQQKNAENEDGTRQPEADAGIKGAEGENEPHQDRNKLDLLDNPDATKEPPSQGDGEGSQDERVSRLHKEFEELSDGQKSELAILQKNGAGKRISQLTYRAKSAEEQVAALQQQVAQNQEPWKQGKPEENPLRDLDTVDKLQEEYQKALKQRDLAEDALDNDPDESGFITRDKEGNGLKRAEVKTYLRSARDTIEKYIPEQFEVLKAKASLQYQVEASEELGAQHFPEWWENKESKESQLLSRMITEVPDFKYLAENTPQGKLYLAAAAESLVRRGLMPDDSGSAKSQPEGNGGSEGKEILPDNGTKKPDPPITPTGAEKKADPNLPGQETEKLKTLQAVKTKIQKSGSSGMTAEMWKELKAAKN